MSQTAAPSDAHQAPLVLNKYVLLDYIVRPCKDSHTSLKCLASRLFGLPKNPQDPAFRLRRQQLLTIVAAAGEDASLPDDEDSKPLHQLQDLLSQETIQESPSTLRQMARLLGSQWSRWDPADLLQKVSAQHKSALEACLAVEVLRDLLHAEYLEAVRSSLLHEDGPLLCCKSNLIELPSGRRYTPHGLERICFAMRQLFSASVLQCWNFLFPLKEQDLCVAEVEGQHDLLQQPWGEDLRSLRNFSTNLLLYAHRWSSLQEDPALVRDFKDKLLRMSSLALNGKVATRFACEASVRLVEFFSGFFLEAWYHPELRSFGPGQAPGRQLAATKDLMSHELSRFWRRVLMPTYPENTFAQRLPRVLLGFSWPEIHQALRDLVLEHGPIPSEDLDQAFLYAHLPEGEHAVRDFLRALQSLYHEVYRSCSENLSLQLQDAAFSSCLVPDEAWTSPESLSWLQAIFRNQQKFSFKAPFLEEIRLDQFARTCPREQESLCFFYKPFEQDKLLEHPILEPFGLRVKEDTHWPLFQALPCSLQGLDFPELLASLKEQNVAVWIKDPGYSKSALLKLQAAGANILSGGRSQSWSSISEKLGAQLRAVEAKRLKRLLLELPAKQIPPRLRLGNVSLSCPPAKAIVIGGREEVEGLWTVRRGGEEKVVLAHATSLLAGIPIFRQGRHGQSSLFYLERLREGVFYPCYSSGVALLEDFSDKDMEILKTHVQDPKRRALLQAGARAVLFSDHMPGLVNPNRLCTLPFAQSRAKPLVSLLTSLGCAMYCWSPAALASPEPGMRLFTLDMLFDESENLFDPQLFQGTEATPASRDLIKHRMLRSLDSFSLRELSLQMPSLEVTEGDEEEEEEEQACRSAAALKHLAVARHATAPHEEELLKRVPGLLLSPRPADDACRVLPLQRVDTSRVYQTTCIGSSSCTRTACRELRGIQRTIVCQECSPWSEEPLHCLQACQYPLPDRRPCAAAATKQLKQRHGIRLYPAFLCEAHALLEEVAEATRLGISSQDAVVLKPVKASLRVRSPGTYPTSYAIRENRKDVEPVFEAAGLSRDCLEVLLVQLDRLSDWMRRHQHSLRRLRAFLVFDDLTKQLCVAALARAPLSRSPSVSSVFGTQEIPRSLEEVLSRHDAELLLLCRQAAAAPAQTDGGSESSSGLQLVSLPAATLLRQGRTFQDLPDTLKLSQNFVQSAEDKDLLASLMLELSDQTNAFFDCETKKVKLQLRSMALREQTWVEDFTLGSVFTFLALGDAEKRLECSKTSQPWIQVAVATFREYLAFFQSRAAWRYCPELRLERSGSTWSFSFHRGLRNLSLAPTREEAIKELEALFTALKELYESCKASYGGDHARGVLDSICLFSEEFLQKQEKLMTPGAFILSVILPRLEQLPALQECVELLCGKGRCSGDRGPLVALLSHAFFSGDKEVLLQKLQCIDRKFTELGCSVSSRVSKSSSLLKKLFKSHVLVKEIQEALTLLLQSLSVSEDGKRRGAATTALPGGNVGSKKQRRQ